MRHIVGTHDIVFITLDTLRYDVAQQLWASQQLPNFTKLLPHTGWEKRHTPGSFTFAAHQAFFAGFLPTPARPGKHPRLFATEFQGSETATTDTFTFKESNIVKGLEQQSYRTICIGGVGFFNQQTALSRVFPSMFQESYWSPDFGVTCPNSAQYQFQKAAARLAESSLEQRVFLFINVSALHQPNYFYLNKDKKEDNLESHAAALQYVDSQLPILLKALKRRGKVFGIVCADHGTTYGEDGYVGHRLAHPQVWEVPYAEFTFG